MDRGFTPVVEGTLKGPEAVFGLLADQFEIQRESSSNRPNSFCDS